MYLNGSNLPLFLQFKIIFYKFYSLIYLLVLVFSILSFKYTNNFSIYFSTDGELLLISWWSIICEEIIIAFLHATLYGSYLYYSTLMFLYGSIESRIDVSSSNFVFVYMPLINGA